jgi:small subunit ribosomal protein S18
MAKKRFKPRRYRVGACPFCQSDQKLDCKQVETLSQYLTDRGKIVSRKRTGVCAKHQRRLAREIKRARHLALLPFVIKV